MLSKQNIAIVAPDFLFGYGLKSLLYEYFNPAEINIFPSTEEYLNYQNSVYQLLILSAVDYLTYANRLTTKNKIVAIASKPQPNTTGQTPQLYTQCDEQEVVEQLQQIFSNFDSAQINSAKSELSEREREVLAKVAQGAINKEIADSLNISLNTVITHRKNITAKLGIKTISGLTVYAILNGIISDKELPKS